MNDTIYSTYLLEDSLLRDEFFLPDELLYEEQDEVSMKTCTPDAMDSVVSEDIDNFKPEDLYPDIDESMSSNSEDSFQLNIEEECEPKYPKIDDEVDALNFFFTKPTTASEEVAKNKMKILGKFDPKDPEERRPGSVKRKFDNSFDRSFQSVSPANFKFKLDNPHRSSLMECGSTKKRRGRLSIAESYWKNKVDNDKIYPLEVIKRCLDVVSIHEDDYIITRLTDGSVVPILWRNFPFLAYEKFWRIRSILSESVTDRRKRQSKLYNERKRTSVIIINS
uniref:ETS domain-containing protein n=1 Tax=Strongyloides venezuelensis TaxID=75913 RepID=A0A0K0EZ84_STRVS